MLIGVSFTRRRKQALSWYFVENHKKQGILAMDSEDELEERLALGSSTRGKDFAAWNAWEEVIGIYRLVLQLIFVKYHWLL